MVHSEPPERRSLAILGAANGCKHRDARGDASQAGARDARRRYSAEVGTAMGQRNCIK
jgi:hypothetical protein